MQQRGTPITLEQRLRGSGSAQTLVALSLVLLSAVAPAAGPTSPAKPTGDVSQRYLDAAIESYTAFEFERSLEQLGKARQHASGLKMDVTIALYEGVVLMELGRDEQAKTAFTTALALDPEAALPMKVSPKVSAVFASAKRARPPTKPVVTQPTTPAEPAPAAPPPALTAAPTSSPPAAAWVPGAVGLALAVTGGVCLGLANTQLQRLRLRGPDALDVDAAAKARDDGALLQTLGWASLAGGVAGLATTAVLAWVVSWPLESSQNAPELALSLGSNGVVVSGHW